MALETCTLKLACTVMMKKCPSGQKEHRGETLKKVEKGAVSFLSFQLINNTL